ncbi:MAG: protein disulfide oxidoreductase [Neisseria sp.]|nr:protein disulfide oxidoreductase [Neisseria sp.]
MKQYVIKAVRQAALFLLFFAAVRIATDLMRRPTLPARQAAQTLTTISGGKVDLSEASRQGAVLVYFWGSWCSICRHTSPAVQELAQDGVPVVSVALRSGSPGDVAGYLKDKGWDFPAVNDENGKLAAAWGIKATPTVIILKDGEIAHSTVGISRYWDLRIRLWMAGM